MLKGSHPRAYFPPKHLHGSVLLILHIVDIYSVCWKLMKNCIRWANFFFLYCVLKPRKKSVYMAK